MGCYRTTVTNLSRCLGYGRNFYTKPPNPGSRNEWIQKEVDALHDMVNAAYPGLFTDDISQKEREFVALQRAGAISVSDDFALNGSAVRTAVIVTKANEVLPPTPSIQSRATLTQRSIVYTTRHVRWVDAV